ncbi:uncharacterized protein LOC123199550 [Mangifera indica]|uniref:uncharacterized protein LOC123199550 n=1 Tax=Mangifera indica TaxID=29780 RepID=UPI001CFBE2CB|nr:uncharacterized protein LOC123199550 [Mangifera indica]
MGVCASYPGANEIKGGGEDHNGVRWPSTAKVIHMDGRVEELKAPIPARNIISQNPNHFLCSSEAMSMNNCMPQMPGEEELQLGQIYFLLPLSHAHKLLALKDMCSLAIKANSAFGN